MRKRHGAVFAALVMTAACGGSGGGAGHITSLADYANAVVKRSCEIEVACGAARDQGSCEAATTFAQTRDVLTIEAAIGRGTVTFDGAAAAACLAALPMDCAVTASRDVMPAACRTVTTGKVATGGACVADAECMADGVCTPPAACTDACCPGICAVRPAPVALGGDCSAGGAACATGAYCAGGTSCAAQLTAGSACDRADACAPPALCASSDGVASQTCVVPPGDGAACNPLADEPCGLTSDYCEPTTLRCARRKPPGAVCANDAECVAYARCASAMCKALPVLGEACDDTPGGACFGSLVCMAGTCAKPPAGSACVPS